MPNLSPSASPAAGFSNAADVVRCLSAGGLSACTVTEFYGGEPDVRIQVRCPGRDVTVELLCCDEDHPTPRWHGVRDDGKRRVVWRGPDIACRPPHVARFVEDLLRRPPGELSARYQLLG